MTSHKPPDITYEQICTAFYCTVSVIAWFLHGKSVKLFQNKSCGWFLFDSKYVSSKVLNYLMISDDHYDISNLIIKEKSFEKKETGRRVQISDNKPMKNRTTLQTCYTCWSAA